MFNLVLKLYKLYLFGTSIFFSIQFWYKNYYYYFSPWFERRETKKRERERERERDHQILTVKKEKYRWHQFMSLKSRSLCQMIRFDDKSST